MRFDFAEAPREWANWSASSTRRAPPRFCFHPAQLSLVSFTSRNDFSAQSMSATNLLSHSEATINND